MTTTTESPQGHADLDIDERKAAPVTLEAFLDLLEWWACGDEDRPGMSPPLSLGWDIRNRFGDEGFPIWRYLMMVWEPPFLASELLPGDQRTAVTLEQYEAALIEDWADLDRGMRQFDWLIIDAMSHAQQDGWEVSGSETTIHATEATLDDLARRAGAKRAAELAPEIAREERQFARATKCYDLDDTAYAKWIATGEPPGKALKFERWRHRRLRERQRAALDELHAMDIKTQRIHVAADSTDAECDAASDALENFRGTWHQHYDHLWPELLDIAPPLATGTPMPPTSHLKSVPASPLPDILTSSRDFIAGFVPPEFVIDGIIQRRYCYSMTSPTGVGKTAIGMRWMAHVVLGRPIGDREVQQGNVLYLAGENPEDVRARWLVLARDMGIDPDTDKVTWLVGTDMGTAGNRLALEAARKGLEFALAIVDTAAAFNPGDDENSNNQAGAYARSLRSLSNLPGGPCVVILCHPTKRAADDDLQPRGGGAFMAEVDGNIAVRRKDSLLVAAPFGKFRGDMSWSQKYEIAVVADHPKLKDARGRQMKSVLARPVSEATAAALEHSGERDEDSVLRVLPSHSEAGLTATDIARKLRWFIKNDTTQPAHHRVKRLVDRLRDSKLVEVVRETKWRLTSKGEIEVNRLEAAMAQAVPMPPVYPNPS
jgi:hypothetical protein